jgi:Guanylate-binding protein, N-terminal domain
MGHASGFTVGPTVKACTKGIWIWGKAVRAEGGDCHVLFLDTEGLGSTIRGASYDSRVFSLAILLSSVFVYNSTGVIDGDAISRLSLVVNLTKHIHVRATTAEVRS